MGKNEKSSKKVGQIASEALRTGKATPDEVLKLAGSVLTQRPDQPKPAKKKGK
jgi:hypothetical protein